MPRGTEPLLGDELVDAYRAFLAEIYDSLARDGFPDIPQSATTVFRDIDVAGSFVSDLAVQAGVSIHHMWWIVRTLEERGYVTVDDETVIPAERGHQAFEAGRRALERAERRLAAKVGPDRYATFRTVLRQVGS